MTGKTASILIGVTLGVACGIGGYTFIYAKGGSYLTDNPEACANCHIMQEHFDAWVKSSHHSFATCNDCHTPANFVGKYATKANNGFWHSFAFTTGRYPEPIRIKGYNRDVAEASCRKCHEEIIGGIEADAHSGNMSCVRCHGAVGHPK
jgi:cytochrome c nitrite reductase small subunit